LAEPVGEERLVWEVLLAALLLSRQGPPRGILLATLLTKQLVFTPNNCQPEPLL
jgi:hypothetical protein